MSATAFIPLAEYLRTSYHPDVDFLEGELLERNSGEQQHGTVQAFLVGVFRNQRKEWSVRALPEQRVQVRPDRFRIPDVCVLRATDPWDPIVRFPPLLCIEVLSSGDTLRSMQERVDDYVAMGVRNIWVLDPWKRLGYNASSQGFEPPSDSWLRISGTDIAVDLREAFAELDEG